MQLHFPIHKTSKTKNNNTDISILFSALKDKSFFFPQELAK